MHGTTRIITLKAHWKQTLNYSTLTRYCITWLRQILLPHSNFNIPLKPLQPFFFSYWIPCLWQISPPELIFDISLRPLQQNFFWVTEILVFDEFHCLNRFLKAYWNHFESTLNTLITVTELLDIDKILYYLFLWVPEFLVLHLYFGIFLNVIEETFSKFWWKIIFLLGN